MSTEVPKVGEGREKIWVEEIGKLIQKYRAELVRNVELRLKEVRKNETT